MNPHHRSLIQALTLLLAPQVCGHASAAEIILLPQLKPLSLPVVRIDTDLEARMPVMYAIDPEEAERLRHRIASRDRPELRQRDALLPDPPTGRILVDQVLAEVGPGRPILVHTTQAAPPPHVYHLRYLAPNFVLPVASGT
jgi:hypothetical protein